MTVQTRDRQRREPLRARKLTGKVYAGRVVLGLTRRMARNK